MTGLSTKPKTSLRLAPGAEGSRRERAGARPVKPATENASLAIRGLILDLANVIYDATLWRRELVRLLGRLHVPATYPAFFDRWQRDYLLDVQRGFRQYDEAFQAFLLSAGLSWGQIDEVEAFARCQRQAFEDNLRPLPAVAQTLSTLTERGVQLVALCDASQPAAFLARRVERLGMGGAFRQVLSSLDLGATKPAADCYTAALAALDLPACDVALVGCDCRSLDGARACGLRTIALNAQEPLEADAHLTSFAEILELVEHWPNQNSFSHPDCETSL
jgi:FMN phosphatase YigB (HAD superfamily)